MAQMYRMTTMATQIDPMTPYLYKIEKFSRETHDTFTINLNPSNGQSNGKFNPGQFNMLYVYGAGEIPISISGDPYKPETLTHTTRVVGTVTRAMRALKPGETIGIRGPFGTHWPVEEAFGDDIIIIAGGIGLAPLRPAIYQIFAHREKFGKVVVLYGMTTEEMLDYILTLIETYDPLYEHMDGEPGWLEADKSDRDVSMAIRTLWNEVEIDVHQMLGKEPVRH